MSKICYNICIPYFFETQTQLLGVSKKRANIFLTTRRNTTMENTMKKAFNWWNSKGVPFIRNYIYPAIDSLFESLIHAFKISWVSILCLFCLYYLSRNGYLDEVPAIKWLVESTVRLIDWIFAVIKDFLGITVNAPVSPFSLFRPLQDWLKYIFAI